MTLSSRLRAKRKKRGLRQEDVARELGVHRVTVAKWETGRMGFHPAMREKIERWIDGRE